MATIDLGHEGPVEICEQCCLTRIEVFDGSFEQICIALGQHSLFMSRYGDAPMDVAQCPACASGPKRLEYEDSKIELSFCNGCDALLLGPHEVFAVREYHFRKRD